MPTPALIVSEKSFFFFFDSWSRNIYEFNGDIPDDSCKEEMEFSAPKWKDCSNPRNSPTTDLHGDERIENVPITTLESSLTNSLTSKKVSNFLADRCMIRLQFFSCSNASLLFRVKCHSTELRQIVIISHVVAIVTNTKICIKYTRLLSRFYDSHDYKI